MPKYPPGARPAPTPRHTSAAEAHRFIEALDRAATDPSHEVDTTLEDMLQVHGGRSATLAAGAAERFQLSPRHTETVETLLTALNDHVREGRLALSPEGAVTLVSQTPNVLGFASNANKVKVKAHWWGVKITIPHAVVAALSSVAATVAAILMAAGVLGWIATLAGAVIAKLAAALKKLDKGKGIWIRITWVGFPIGFGAL